jgi:hypothetical protein
MCDAWKRKPDANSESGFGSGEFRGQQPGDQCTINGAPGHQSSPWVHPRPAGQRTGAHDERR